MYTNLKTLLDGVILVLFAVIMLGITMLGGAGMDLLFN